jgi:hypothetical protein
MPGLGWTNNSLFSFWGSPFSRPSSVQYGTDVKRYSDATTAVIHMFHGSLWGGWQFQVASQQANASTFKFGYGGYQEARGSGIKAGQHYFIENVSLCVKQGMLSFLSSLRLCCSCECPKVKLVLAGDRRA